MKLSQKASLSGISLEGLANNTVPPNVLVFSLEIADFQKIVGGFIEMVDTLAKEVEKEKMKVWVLISKYISQIIIYP